MIGANNGDFVRRHDLGVYRRLDRDHRCREFCGCARSVGFEGEDGHGSGHDKKK